jgi:hypothetical protein
MIMLIYFGELYFLIEREKKEYKTRYTQPTWGYIDKKCSTYPKTMFLGYINFCVLYHNNKKKGGWKKR